MFLGLFSKTDTTILQQRSLLDSSPSTEFSGRMPKFLRYLAEYLATLTFLCCHYMFDSYITSLTFCLNTIYVYFHSTFLFLLVFFFVPWTVIILAALKSILNQSRCSLEPKNFLRVLCPLKPLLHWGLRTPSPTETRYAHFCAN